MEMSTTSQYKKIGILGGMSAESTVTYYQYITRTYTERFKNYAYPEIIIYSMKFQDYADWPTNGQWDLIIKGLTEASKKLEAAGADFIVIACNTVHKVFDCIKDNVRIPMLSLTEAVADAILARHINTVGLLGTKVTMEGGFYEKSLNRKDVRVIVPDPKDRELINTIIYGELVNGVVENSSRNEFLRVIGKLSDQGAEGVILGCTELGLLINETHCHLPLFDSTLIHAEATLQYAIS
jgi:aspartate racemase